MARPRTEISRLEFEKLCALQCNLNEIASFFDCSPDTIERWCVREYGESFAETFAKKRGAGMISLRRAQFRLAEKSATMAIFLGKNYLGQEDGFTHRVNIDSDARQTVEDLLLEAEESADRPDQTEAGN